MKFKSWLNEKSYTSKDIPDYFYVVFDLRDSLDGLKKGQFKDMKGISSSNEIEFQFLGVARDAMLKMDSTELLNLNKITRINYEKPEFLVSKNLWALRRLYNASKTKWVDQVFGNLFERLILHMKKNNVDKMLVYDMDYYGFRNVDWDWSKSIENKLNIKTLKDLTKVVERYIRTIFIPKTRRTEDYKFTTKEIYDSLYSALQEIGRIYSTEAEWVVKDTIFKIPKKSELIVLVPHFHNYRQDIYDVCAEWAKDNVKDDSYLSTMDTIRLQIKVDEMFGSEVSKKDSVGVYVKLYQINKKIEPVENKYKITRLDNEEFKAEQRKYFKEN